ncbi:MAG: hypothetical protein HIU89_16735 [Proteobacteria bacterium]|nr:hypothetical protein [Pseudomonadota bacterium]
MQGHHQRRHRGPENHHAGRRPVAERDKASTTGKKLGMGSLVSLKTFRGVAGDRLAELERYVPKAEDLGEGDPA